MKNASIILLIAIVAITIAGCTGTMIKDPIIGTWRDNVMGVSQMEFLENHQLHVLILDSYYVGNWSNIDSNHYQINYTDTSNSSLSFSRIVNYDQVNYSIYMDNKKDIQYYKIADKIQGNWTDEKHIFYMQFGETHAWDFTFNNSSYMGNWSKINDTSYVVIYADPANQKINYREWIFYNNSNSYIKLDNIPYVNFTRTLESKS